jgi:hypothetical protein
MDEAYRRSLEELVTRYAFEPQIRDLFVEGERDQRALEWFFQATELEAKVYLVDSVQLPNQMLEGLEVFGNKGRVVALCKHLESELSEASNVLGLVDKDDSDLLNIAFRSAYLLTTDYSCFECYGLGASTLAKFFALYFARRSKQEHLEDMFGILTEIFLLRAAKRVLAREARWIDQYTRFCDLESGRIVFDRSTFVERLANASRRQLTGSSLDAKVSELRGSVSGDVRNYINGHALTQMLSWYAHQIGVPPPLCNEAAIQRALIATVTLEEFLLTPLFQNLRRWAE